MAARAAAVMLIGLGKLTTGNMRHPATETAGSTKLSRQVGAGPRLSPSFGEGKPSVVKYGLLNRDH
jgi:hypothetical protein